MNTDTHTSDAEAEQAGTREDRCEASLLTPQTLKLGFKLLIGWLKVFGLAAKLWDWFV